MSEKELIAGILSESTLGSEFLKLNKLYTDIIGVIALGVAQKVDAISKLGFNPFLTNSKGIKFYAIAGMLVILAPEEQNIESLGELMEYAGQRVDSTPSVYLYHRSYICAKLRVDKFSYNESRRYGLSIIQSRIRGKIKELRSLDIRVCALSKHNLHFADLDCTVHFFDLTFWERSKIALTDVEIWDMVEELTLS